MNVAGRAGDLVDLGVRCGGVCVSHGAFCCGSREVGLGHRGFEDRVAVGRRVVGNSVAGLPAAGVRGGRPRVADRLGAHFHDPAAA